MPAVIMLLHEREKEGETDEWRDRQRIGEHEDPDPNLIWIFFFLTPNSVA